MTNADLVRALAALDLNEYEARIYLALLGADALTAYELGKRAGVPLSRCYEVARSLAGKGLAATQPGETPRYRAVEPALAIAAQRRELDALGAALARHASRDDREPLWTLQGRGLILATASALLDAAAERVALWAPPDALEALDDRIAAARARRLTVAVRPDPALLLVRDADEALLGQVDPPERALATQLRQPAVVAWLAARAWTGADAPTDREDALPAPAQPAGEAAWLDWESRKVRRLLASVPGLSDLDAR
jgi:sugar-specific transcriptional regulator TrmB